MGKPNMYGMKKVYNPKLWRGLPYRKKTDPRPREQRNTQAAQLPTKKQEASDGNC